MIQPTSMGKMTNVASRFFDKRFAIFAAIVSVVGAVAFWFLSHAALSVLPRFLLLNAPMNWLLLMVAWAVTHMGKIIHQRYRSRYTQWLPALFLGTYLIGTYKFFRWVAK